MRSTTFIFAALLLCSMTTMPLRATEVMHRPNVFAANASVYAEAGRFPRRGFCAVRQKRSTQTVFTSTSGAVNMAYFVNWGIYGRKFPPSSIIPSTLTHILYAFCDTDASTGTVKLSDTYADQEIHYPGDSWDETGKNVYGCFKQLFLLKQQNRNLKTLLSIGGWTYSQAGHFGFVTSPTARANFINSAITLMEDNGFDGIDIDFEYPKADEKDGFASLITELRAALDAHAVKKGDSIPYLVTIAVGAGPVGYTYLDIPRLDASLNFWNLMAYDYSGAWSNVSDNQANVYGGAESGFSTDSALTYYIGNGATPGKIVLGIPLYGRSFAQTDGMHEAYSGVGEGSWENGIWDYKVLPQAGAQVVEDDQDIASYSYDPSKKLLISYDTPNVVRKKVSYAQSKGLAGAMYWELSSDKVGEDSLVGTVATTFGVLQQSQNHVNYPYSQWDNIRNGMGSSPGSPPPTTGAGTTTQPGGPTDTETETETGTDTATTPRGTGMSSTSTGRGATTTAPSTNTGTGGGTTSPAATNTAGSGDCAGVPAWDAATAYSSGDTVTYGGHLWLAHWWNQGEKPAAVDGNSWTDKGAC